MKKFLLLIPLLLVCTFAHAQGFRWQGIAKDANGNAVTQQVTLQFNILKNNATVYSETHPTQTPIAGQLTATVGSITPTSFTALDWSSGAFTLEVKMTVNGVTTASSSPILPVPIALYAANSGGASGNSAWSLNNNILSTDKETQINKSLFVGNRLNVEYNGNDDNYIGHFTKTVPAMLILVLDLLIYLHQTQNVPFLLFVIIFLPLMF
jgi:hypothetical protein